MKLKGFASTGLLFLNFSLYVACTATPNPASMSTSTDTPDGEAVSFQTQIQPIINTKCLACHGTGSREGDFTSYAGIKREIGDIRMHALIIKNMPPRTEPQLSAEESQLLKSWIDNNAPEN